MYNLEVNILFFLTTNSEVVYHKSSVSPIISQNLNVRCWEEGRGRVCLIEIEIEIKIL